MQDLLQRANELLEYPRWPRVAPALTSTITSSLPFAAHIEIPYSKHDLYIKEFPQSPAP